RTPATDKGPGPVSKAREATKLGTTRSSKRSSRSAANRRRDRRVEGDARMADLPERGLRKTGCSVAAIIPGRQGRGKKILQPQLSAAARSSKAPSGRRKR